MELDPHNFQLSPEQLALLGQFAARTGKPHTKVFHEERNRPVFVWLDLRKPMLFATRGAY